ncbi:MAG: hypothetical protein KA223_09280, partial [Candidatus Accumulibacter sp.]|nr:hypothetical protein [Accumulibacter sp.]
PVDHSMFLRSMGNPTAPLRAYEPPPSDVSSKSYSMSFERAKSHPNPASPSAIGQELLQLFGAPVNVLTRGALPRKLRATVLAEALPLATKAGGRPDGRHCGAQGTAFSSAAE